jgi:hypothetical protein
VLEHGNREDFFQFFGERLRPMLPSNATFLLGVPTFPECHALLDTRGSLHSPSAILPRVQHSGTQGSLWHSGNLASPVVHVDTTHALLRMASATLIGRQAKGTGKHKLATHAKICGGSNDT